MIKLIIDSDVALGVHHENRPRDIDDGFAIVEAINSDAIELKAVTTVFGNGPLAEVDRVARELIALKEADVSVHSGATGAMASDGSTPPNEAVVAMARILKSERCHIAAIGPLSNIGLLIAHYPGVLGNDVDWLETDVDFASNRITYLTGFSDDGARRFVEDIVTSVY